LVADQGTGELLYEKDADRVTSIASITKLMTAMVILDARLPMGEPVTVTQDDVDTLRNSLSRLPVGWTLTREEMLRLALMASENRAASALARTFPGGTQAFVAAMNAKALSLGMGHTHFVDPHGLHAENASTAKDLLLMANAAYGYPTIRRMTTTPSHTVVSLGSGRSRTFGNSDYLVASDRWVVGLSKTGFINESGYCLVLQATIKERSVVMVFLDSVGKHSRQGDAARVRAWLETGSGDMALGTKSPDGQRAG
jgi:D-alanyl-D-alanine endopeptidase (penicillin-binding protein 7)